MDNKFNKMCPESSDCPICIGWIARCMVEPIRGHPNRYSLQSRDGRQIASRTEYWNIHYEVLKNHGVEYDASTEKIESYLDDYYGPDYYTKIATSFKDKKNEVQD